MQKANTTQMLVKRVYEETGKTRKRNTEKAFFSQLAKHEIDNILNCQRTSVNDQYSNSGFHADSLAGIMVQNQLNVMEIA